MLVVFAFLSSTSTRENDHPWDLLWHMFSLYSLESIQCFSSARERAPQVSLVCLLVECIQNSPGFYLPKNLAVSQTYGVCFSKPEWVWYCLELPVYFGGVMLPVCRGEITPGWSWLKRCFVGGDPRWRRPSCTRERWDESVQPIHPRSRLVFTHPSVCLAWLCNYVPCLHTVCPGFNNQSACWNAVCMDWSSHRRGELCLSSSVW